MNDRRGRLIAELIHHLENMDGEELKSKMQPKVVEIDLEGKVPMHKDTMDKEKGPMEEMVEAEGGPHAKVEDAVSHDPEHEEMDDDEFEELMKMHGGK